MWSQEDEYMMNQALLEAQRALEEGEIPVGAVVARRGGIIARGRNTRQGSNDPAGHAEINVLREAARVVGDWRLSGCVLYVTLEPCPMCAGAIGQARLDRVVFGAHDRQMGACGSLYRLTEDPAFPFSTPADGGLFEDRCSALIARALKR